MANKKEIILLSRDTFALMVPSGARVMLHQGTEVMVTQSLGNAFTINVYGNLMRIDGADADALGKTIIDPLSDMPENATLNERIWAVLNTIFDPEIPVSIVDLGLVYDVSIEPKEDDGSVYTVKITMTLTSPTCGMGPVLTNDVQTRVASIETIDSVEVDVVFEPPWDKSMMSDVAQVQLGMY